jgi:hypothetical protein
MRVQALVAAYDLYKSIALLFSLVLMVVMGLFLFGSSIYTELSKQANYRAKFGENWKMAYEKDNGTLTKARVRIAMSSLGTLMIASSLVWLYKLLSRDNRLRRSPYNPYQRHDSHRDNSTRYRRNAFLGISLGLFGIGLGLYPVVLQFRSPVGVYSDVTDEIVLGLGVFLCGYCGVISGCWWWLKAKAWNESLVLVGLLPLVLLLIPFVRLIFLAAPGVLLIGMVMMPAILIVVVLVLPDHSGPLKRRR